MRIGVDCRPLQEKYPTGVSVYTLELLRALVQLPQAQEHTFVFFINESGLQKNSKRLSDIQAGLHFPNIEWAIHSVPNKLLTIAEVLFFRPHIEWMMGNVDVVFVPNMQFFPLQDPTVPVVLTIHDLSFERERYRECLDVKGRLRHRFLRPRTFVNHAKHIITVSEHTRSDIQTLYGVPQEKTSVVYPGLAKTDATEQRTNPEALPFELPPKYILSLSTIEPRKNIDSLIEAFYVVQEQHPDVQLIIAGASGWKSPNEYFWRLKECTGVRYLGYVSESIKRQLLQNAQLFVYPSLYEGFGFPPLEAQTVGVPVIVGAHSSLPEVLGESALYADVLDVNSLARAMNHLLTDTALVQDLQKKGYENVKRFQWNTTAQQTLDILLAAV